MNKEDAKKAFSEAEKEQREKEIAQLKEIVKKTLSELEKLKSQKKEVDGKIKILKMDLDDLKEGRLDRIEERQQKDPQAKEISVILVKEKEVERIIEKPYYVPYYVEINPIYVQPQIHICDNGTAAWPVTNTDTVWDNSITTFTGSFTYNNTAGTYTVDDKTIHLR